MTATKMQKLYMAITHTYSHKAEWTGGRDESPIKLEVYIDEPAMDVLAKFIGISKRALNVALQRTTGVPLQEAPLPPSISDKLKELREAGCDIEVKPLSLYDTYEVILFGNRINLAQTESSHAVRRILHGIERGFVSSPLWEGSQQILVPRSQFRATLEHIKEMLNSKSDAAIERFCNEAIKEPMKHGSPQLTSALKTLRQPMARVTRRSKRSA